MLEILNFEGVTTLLRTSYACSAGRSFAAVSSTRICLSIINQKGHCLALSYREVLCSRFINKNMLEHYQSKGPLSGTELQ
ncbi:hypothetical protein Ancab_027843, partial [Ancistrocladus abbreviatus]